MDSIGEFLRILFYNPIRISGKDDPRGTAHGLAVARFLQGKTNVKMSEIIELIYSPKHSAPSSRSTHYHERHAPFSPSVSPSDIQHAHPCLFTWAKNLVGKHVYQEIYKLVRPIIETEGGNCPRRKVPMVPNAERNARPHSLIRWTSSTHTNKMVARKVGYSVISLHSLSCRCSGSTQMTCHSMHSLISPAKRIPALRATLKVSWQ